MTPHRLTQAPRRAAGFSLVELMISLVIGMVVIGAVLAAYLGTGFAGRNNQALSQITEDASVSLNVLRSHLAMVGYSRPIGVAGNTFTRAYGQRGLIGCRGQFTDLGLAIDALTCAGSDAGDANSIAIAYEADTHNSVANADGRPLDCLGNSLELQNPNNFYLSYSRFYLAQPGGGGAKALYCRGEGAEQSQALVENVEDLQVRYGVAAADVVDEDRRVGFYGKAEDLTPAQFDRVMAVKICVLVASANEVMDQATAYQPCDPFAAKVTPEDRRMYRAFTTTVVMHNRLGVLAPVGGEE